MVVEAGGASFHYSLLSQGYCGHRCFGLVRMVVRDEDGYTNDQPVHLFSSNGQTIGCAS